jgi:acetamidase/formamidase
MTRRLHDANTDRHLGWSIDHPPVIEVAPGDEVLLVLADCFDGQLSADSTAAEVPDIDLGRANPLTGPIAVDGAKPGDAVVVEILEIINDPVGWTAILPGFGLLADDFDAPHLVVSDIGTERIRFGDIAELTLAPMIGTVGLAPAEPGVHSVIPPRRVGGNLDCRDVRAGTRLWLPVEVDGALLSAGDAHGAQGDGEVCGTGVESAARVRMRVDLEPGVAPDMPHMAWGPRPRATGIRPTRAPATSAAATGPGATAGTWLTTGVGPDLYAGAQAATRAMIELLGRELGLDPADAYALCSVAAHLRIIEVVDAPNWVVGMELEVTDA